MSEGSLKETPKITTILKEKDPKRVEAGKRLAQLNKERKLHKEQQDEIKSNSSAVSCINYSLILNVIGVAAAVVSLYYVRKEFEKKKEPQVEPVNIPSNDNKPQKVTAPQLDSLE